ncbi:MAG: YdeI/OmpD-associated family protein [bacterium]|nr:YdeI/OmpD-associated family protein [bacterium]
MSAPKLTDPIYCPTRAKWRAWLKKNHATAPDVWLAYYKRHTGKPSITHDEAVEEAICFGWIDTTVRRIDEDSFAHRFTPRRKGSVWSVPNRERFARMEKAGMMTDAGKAALKDDSPTYTSTIRNLPPIPVPADLKKALAENKEAAENFKKLTEKYRQMCFRWITLAKRPETRTKRIAEFVDLTARKKRFGMK